MKTVGIIAEYNPFHNGHLYQLEKAKELSGADFAVIVMSGNFVQRGTPALIDKYARTKMALCNGADLILELPVCYATASAEYFAKGAVSLLSALGVDALCFGSECGDV
ncbi:MAG: nucleotidyltransferase family protein, partial [Lachnospiraceae bacterium]|nr:nucleotidyltransferase family protein [Lachnospiraceae bacterium]